MAFDVTSTQNEATIKTKGNVRIDVGHYQSKDINSVYTYNGKTSITNANQKDDILKLQDECYDVLLEITGGDMILEQSDLNRIDQVAKKFKCIESITKKLNEGEVNIDFKSGYNLTIDFYTNKEEKSDDMLLDYKAPYGTKKEYYRQDLIEKLKDSYNITEQVCTDSQGKKYKAYNITAKQNVNLAKLKSDLGLRDGIVNKYNYGYGQYDYNGHYIDNKPMKDISIKIPVSELGYTNDERNIFIRILDAIFG